MKHRPFILLSAWVFAACSAAVATESKKVCPCKDPSAAAATNLAFSLQKTGGASAAFWQHWGDGKGELSGYEVTTMRYGQPRKGRVVLVYVTEPLDRRTLIKNDGVSAAQKLPVLKLNHMLTFDTGIYPYSVMTSIFAPVERFSGQAPFSPVKLALSAQEWCGHVYYQLRPRGASTYASLRSYFSSEGETDQLIEVGSSALYEDALLIQLRELDGPFNGGRDWSGRLVPTLWATRKAHRPLGAVAATLKRSLAERAGVKVTRFTLEYGGFKRTYDVERQAPHRVLGWEASDGEKAQILKTARLPYWRLHENGDEKHRQALGF